ncbi:MAG: hypothetical protein MUD10_05625 [Candidatus Pacebacteria bacterium]|jgi:hypothetical protein|nr:hypothetical protein [Candidatus Paceibacterota bacterium]
MPEQPGRNGCEFNDFERPDSILEQLKQSRPESVFLPIKGAKHHSDKKLGEAIRLFRDNYGRREVVISAGNCDGKLFFDPKLVSFSDIQDDDYGAHRDDSTGVINYYVKYVLSEADLGQTPEELEEKIFDTLEELKKPDWRTDLFESHADWMEEGIYEKKMQDIKRLTVEERNIILNDKNNPARDLLMERVENADFEVNSLVERLPVVNYGNVGEGGGVEWFGLPVMREPATEVRAVGRLGRAVEEEKIGISTFKIGYLSKVDLSAWLDQYSGIFKEIIGQKQGASLPENIDIRELDMTVRDYTKKLAAEAGFAMKSTAGYDEGWVFDSGKCKLNLDIELRGDYKGLNVRVLNINGGIGRPDDPQAIVDLVRSRGFKLAGNAYRMLAEAIEEDRLRDLKFDKGSERIDYEKTEAQIARFKDFTKKASAETGENEQTNENSGESRPDHEIFRQIEEFYGSIDPEKYWKYGLESVEFESMKARIEGVRKGLGNSAPKVRADLLSLRQELADAVDYRRKRDAAIEAADKAIEENFGICPLCGKNLVEGACDNDHDIERIVHELNENQNWVAPVLISEIITEKGEVVAQQWAADSFSKNRKEGEIYIVFDRDTGESGWRFAPFKSLEVINYGKILSQSEAAAKRNDRLTHKGRTNKR